MSLFEIKVLKLRKSRQVELTNWVDKIHLRGLQLHNIDQDRHQPKYLTKLFCPDLYL